MAASQVVAVNVVLFFSAKLYFFFLKLKLLCIVKRAFVTVHIMKVNRRVEV